jgi:hypothetical protein
MSNEIEIARPARPAEGRQESMPDSSAKFRSCISEEHKEQFDELILKFRDKNNREVTRDRTENKYGAITTVTTFFVGNKQYDMWVSDDLKKPVLDVHGPDGKVHEATKAQRKEALPVFENVDDYFKHGEKCKR